MHNIQDKLGFKNMSDLTIKVIKFIYDTETPRKEQIKKDKKYGNRNLHSWKSFFVNNNEL